jgi:hypothetical protein
MHGQFPCSLHEKLVDNEQLYGWLQFWNIKGETESTIVAGQDQAISTNYFKNKILKEEVDSICELCKQHEGTTDHLTSRCPILVKNEYLMRQDKVGVHLHYSICKALGIETTDKWRARPPTCTHTHARAHACPNQYANMKMWQCYGINGYIQTEKLSHISQI